MSTDTQEIVPKSEATEMDIAETTPTTAAAPAGASDSTAAGTKPEDQTNATNETADVPPNQTLYVNNINEKIKKVRAHGSNHALKRTGQVLRIDLYRRLTIHIMHDYIHCFFFFLSF